MSNRWDPKLYRDRYAFVFQAAEDLLDLLAPQPGERILDLGCGSGELTAKIASRGATVIGLDASDEMIAAARMSHPQVSFMIGDARDFSLDAPVDAVFSNAALHWIPDIGPVIGACARNLRPGGRFVAELGGHGNVATLLDAVTRAGALFSLSLPSPWYFPGIPEFTALLAGHGFETRFAHLFDRPIELQESETGLRDWLRMFGQPFLDRVPAALQDDFLAELEQLTRPHLLHNGRWLIDYRRLRVLAHLTAGA